MKENLNNWILANTEDRGGSRTTATSKMEYFVVLVNDSQPLTNTTKRSILHVAAVLDPPLQDNLSQRETFHFSSTSLSQ